MARKFKLTNQERGDCATAVIVGSGRFNINDKLAEIEGVIDQLIEGSERKGTMYVFDGCNEDQEFDLSEKQFNRLINDLKSYNWASAIMAIGAKKLVAKLEEVPTIKEE